jgi:hypothetical protein
VNFDYLNRKYTRENYKFESNNKYWIYFRDRTKDLNFNLNTIYLSQKGKIKVPYKMRNISYYQGPFLNKKQFEISLNYEHINRNREKKKLEVIGDISNRTRKYWWLEDVSYEWNSFGTSLVYGISDKTNLRFTQNLRYSTDSGLRFSFVEEDLHLNAYPFQRDYRYRQRGSYTFIQFKALLSHSWEVLLDAGVDYCKKRQEGLEELKTWGSTYKSRDISTNLKLVYLSPNPEISFDRLKDDYSNYYGHLLGRNQIKILTDISFKRHRDFNPKPIYMIVEEGDNILIYMDKSSHKIENQTYSPAYRINIASFSQNFEYGFDEKINFGIDFTLNKQIQWFESSKNYHHNLSFNYKFGLVIYNYTYVDDFREDICWEEVSNFNYYFSPLLSRGQSKLRIVFKPKRLYQKWSSSSSGLLDFKTLKVNKDDSWSISTKLQLGITNNLQLTLEQVYSKWDDDGDIALMALFDFQFMKNGRFYVRYERNYIVMYTLYGYLSNSDIVSFENRGATSTFDYDKLTLGINLLIR